MLHKDWFRTQIAKRHGSLAADFIAKIAWKYLNSYHNRGNMDMRLNGEVRALRTILSNTDGEILDVGANEGQWAVAVQAYADGRRIHSFEPVPDTFDRLTANVAGYPNIVANNIALGSREGSLNFRYNSEVSYLTSAYEVISFEEGASDVECRVMRGDTYLEINGVVRVSVLKIDVEGMEAECLAGFEKAFSEGKIASVQFEHGPTHILSNHTLRYFVDWFRERDLGIFSVYPSGLRPLNYSYRDESFEPANFFAIRNDLAPKVVTSG